MRVDADDDVEVWVGRTSVICVMVDYDLRESVSNLRSLSNAPSDFHPCGLHRPEDIGGIIDVDAGEVMV